jgi:hypothetical protein
VRSRRRRIERQRRSVKFTLRAAAAASSTALVAFWSFGIASATRSMSLLCHSYYQIL